MVVQYKPQRHRHPIHCDIAILLRGRRIVISYNESSAFRSRQQYSESDRVQPICYGPWTPYDFLGPFTLRVRIRKLCRSITDRRKGSRISKIERHELLVLSLQRNSPDNELLLRKRYRNGM